MYQVPMHVWNEIAQSQPLSQPWATVFRVEGSKLPEALQPIYDRLEKKGADDRVQRAFVVVAPLLVENESISAYLEESNRMDLRTAMPELTSISEALDLASMEYRLNRRQLDKLAQALREELTSLAAAQPR